MKQQHRAYTYAFLAILCWSTVGTAFKLTLRYTDFLSFLLYSSFFAVCVHLLIIIIQGKTGLLKRLKAKDFLHSAFLGMINPFLYYLVLLKAYDLLRAQEAGTLNYSWPVVLVLLSIPFLKQKISWKSLLAVLVSFTGIIIISTHGHLFSLHFTSAPGVLLALGSAFFWAIYWIFNMKDKREDVTKLFLNFCFGFIYILVTVIVRNEVLQNASFRMQEWRGIAGAAYIGVFEMGITFVFWLMALNLSVTTAKVSNLIFLSPFISLIYIHFIVGETIFLSTFIGLIFIVGGIVLQQYLKR